MSDPEHPDERNVLESSAQTEHKLEIMRRYFPKYAATIANSRTINNRHVWLVDLFAGAGLHRSANHPHGQRDGTALLACIHAWKVQRRFPESRLHVRLVDMNRGFCDRLEERTRWFRELPDDEQIDLRIMCMDFAVAIPIIASDVRLTGDDVRSLWFIDPYEPTPLRYDALLPIIALSHSEIIINFDVTGVVRMRGQVLSERARQSVLASVLQSEGHLNQIYRSDKWREPLKHIRTRPGITENESLAYVYADQFRTFKCQAVYPLDASDQQYRYLVHLSRTPAAEGAFREVYAASNRRGLYTGRSLGEAECAKYADVLMEIFYGREIGVNGLYASDVVPLDRAQIRRVLEYAEGHGYGKLNGDTMHWRVRRDEGAQLAPRRRYGDERQRNLFDPRD
jgi:three-Cys-motif partner protein